MRRHLKDESGFTIIELVVAVLVLTIGTMALLGSFDSSRRLASAAEMHDAGNALAEKELERISSQPWSGMALSGTPARNVGATASDPTDYVSTDSCGSSNTPVASPCYQWDWTTPSAVEPLAIDTTSGTDSATATGWQTTVSSLDGTVRLSGNVYRYITWVKDPRCSSAGCAGAGDAKRITVAVTVRGLPKPITLSTIVVNRAGGTKNPLTSGSTTCVDGEAAVPCVH